MNSLIIKDLKKSFSQKNVLSGINLTFEQNEIYALLGENGAGKTTLASIIYGLIPKDSGSIYATYSPKQNDSNSTIELNINSPKQAIEKKIAYVYQNPFVSEENTCLENIFLHAKSKFIFNRKKIEQKSKQLLNEYKIELDLNKKGKNLTADEKFNLAFLCSLCGMDGKPNVLILDEPTASLTKPQKDNLFVQLEKLKNDGCILIFITHNKTEALQNATKIVFLQNQAEPIIGHAAVEKLKSLVSADELLQQIEKKEHLIFGNNCENSENVNNNGNSNYKEKSKISKKSNNCENSKNNENSKTPILSVQNLFAKESPLLKIENLSFNVFAGKLTCIKGTSETGLLLLENILSRMTKNLHNKKSNNSFSGKMFFEQKDYTKFTPKTLRENNISIIPSNKIARGSPKSLTVQELLLTKMPKSKSDLQIIQDAKVNTTLTDKVASLSGGMLQRLIWERELSLNPKLVILANPFYGLDIESTTFFMQRIEKLLQNGVAILVLSIDDEILEKRSDFFVLLNNSENQNLKDSPNYQKIQNYQKQQNLQNLKNKQSRGTK